MVYYDEKGNIVKLSKMISRGGEGEVWHTNRTATIDGVSCNLVAKIYFQFNSERYDKMKVMLKNPPQNPTKTQNHLSLAWIQELLFDNNKKFAGFLMPEISQSVDLIHIYNPKKRQACLPKFNWKYLHVTAMNLCSVIDALHSKDYIIGDIKPQNILVNNRARVSIIDTDSFQVRLKTSKNEKVYRCSVGSEGFTPPELIGQELAKINQTRSHDRFRLAVIIFYLLFGSHPFDVGTWNGSGDRPAQAELIKNGVWLFSNHQSVVSNQMAIPLTVIHPKLKELFLKCFNDGHNTPASRPSALDWYKALETAQNALVSCGKVDNHVYNKTYGHCYWCERATNLGADIFSSAILSQQPVANTSQTVPVTTVTAITSLVSQFKLGMFWCSLALGVFSVASGQLWLLVIAVPLFFVSFGGN